MTDDLTQAVLGGRLRVARDAAGLSQQYVADHAGIHRSSLSDIEHGHRRVDSLELLVLAGLYGQPVTHFLGDTPAVPTGPEVLVQRLEAVTANLDEYLERRAHEISAPHVQKAHEAARELVTQAQNEERRHRDVADELRRQLGYAFKRAHRAEHRLGMAHSGDECEECDAKRKNVADVVTLPAPPPERTTGHEQ